jgi:ABC-type molybdenum transport system ATPase subunit/photorepair protein PhrA
MINGINIKRVNFSYGNKKILKNITLNINRGDFWGITGVNGSGK